MRWCLLFAFMISIHQALNYHGCTLAPDNLNGWVVCLDSVLILKTTDGGVTWQPQSAPLNTKRFFDVTCTDDQNAWTCGILGEVLHTSDGGMNWTGQVIGLSKYATRIEFYDSLHGWTVCGDGSIGRTTNGGAYWDPTAHGLFEYYGVWFFDTLSGWIVAGYPDSLLSGQGVIAKSSDGGINWNSIYQVSDYRDFFDVHFFNLMEGIVIGGDENDTSAIIMRTTSGGLMWDNIVAPSYSYYLRALDFVDIHGWAVGRSGTIIYTSDAGNTWAFQANPAVSTLFDVDFSDDQHGIACGQDIVLITSDGGQTWIDVGMIVLENRTRAPAQLRVYPNPSRSICHIEFDPNPSINAIKIFDISGRIVRNLSVPNSYPQGPRFHTVWDGLDNNGARAPAGIYMIMIDAGLDESVNITLLD